MKWRIDNSSIRIRLSQTEVAELFEKGILVEKLIFPNNTVLVYEICCDDTAPSITAGYLDDMIVVRIPEKEIKQWGSSKQVSISGQADLENGGKLSILVEKDFKKITRKSSENDRDLYPNPRERK